MFCKNCGHEIVEGSSFCTVCGSPVRTGSVVIPVRPAENTMSSDLGWGKAPDLEGGAGYQPEQNWGGDPNATMVLGDYSDPRDGYQGGYNGGYAQPPVPPAQPANPYAGVNNGPAAPMNYREPNPAGGYGHYSAASPYKATAKKKGAGLKIGIIAGAAAALLLAVVLIVGFATNWFGLTGPGVTIASAMRNTLNSDNFTMDFELDVDGETLRGTIQGDIDYDKRTVTAYIDIKVQGRSMVFALYDGYLIGESMGEYFCQDISEQMDEIFDAYADLEEQGAAELDWEELLDQVDRDAYDEISEYIDFDELETCIAEYAKKFNNESWLKKNAGYSTDKEDGATVYRFAPDTYEFLHASFLMLEPAFHNSSDFEDVLDALEEEENNLSDAFEAEFAVAVKGGKMVGMDLIMESNGSELAVRIDYSKLGSTKIDEAELEDMLERALKKSGL